MSGATEIYYRGALHGLMSTHVDRLNADLLDFLRGLTAACRDEAPRRGIMSAAASALC